MSNNNYYPDFDSDAFLSDYDEYDDYNYKGPPKQTRQYTEAELYAQKINNLYAAICSSNTQKVMEYIDDGLGVDVTIHDGWTPLLLAASFGNADLVDELMKHGADINLKRADLTALMLACKCPATTSPFEETFKIIKILIDNGANPKEINRKRITPLMFAASVANSEAVKYLLPLSNKNAEDNQRWNVMFWAVNANAKDIVVFLLEEGLDCKTVDVRSNTVVELARANDCTEILELFGIAEEYESTFDCFPDEYDEICCLRPKQKPVFPNEIYNLLSGVRCESLTELLITNQINLRNLLSVTSDDLYSSGIKMAYQQERILGGIYRFHKYPFHAIRSLHVVSRDQIYSNQDVAIQLISAIKHVIVMEAGFSYIMKNFKNLNLTRAEKLEMSKTLQQLKTKICLCRDVTKRLKQRIKKWDACVAAPDLIGSRSKGHMWPWRKLIFSVSLITVVLIRFYR